MNEEEKQTLLCSMYSYAHLFVETFRNSHHFQEAEASIIIIFVDFFDPWCIAAYFNASVSLSKRKPGC